MTDYIFAYGSLLNPRSLRRTLPHMGPSLLSYAQLPGYRRCFDVAFPNLGSQTDKAYFDDRGQRPPFVLFVNLVRDDVEPSQVNRAGPANGVLLPVDEADVALLADRERRYSLLDITSEVHLGPDTATAVERVRTFVGRSEFTQADHVARGVIDRNYLDSITAGVAFWDLRRPGFARAFDLSTQTPAPSRVENLRRVARRNNVRGAASSQ